MEEINTNPGQENSEPKKNVEINTGGLSDNKEIDLDRGGIETGSDQDNQSLSDSDEEFEEQHFEEDSSASGRQDYSGNTPDIDEETFKYGNRGDSESAQSQ